MSMVVRTNMNSMNANRNLSINNSYVAKSIEKLASGFQINRASDDASGLAISEKMQAQITGLDQGTENALDGIGLVQTAEGAMSEIHDMLNRIVELATKSANGTIQDEVDREAIQAEVDVLVDEIDRIAQATNFNGIDLLNGNLSDGGLVIKTNTFTETITTENKLEVDTDDTTVFTSKLNIDTSLSTTVGSFTVYGGVQGTDFDYNTTTGELTILSSTDMRIDGNNSTTNEIIVVSDSASSANLALNNVNITSSTTSAFSTGNNDVYIELEGDNELSSSSGGSAGLNVGEFGSITIDGTGELTATSSYSGAGIGSDNSGTSGDITINGGTITATGSTITTTGSSFGAGIGSGDGGTVGDITINGGTIIATGGNVGAGIGTGEGGVSGDITITGGTIIATCGSFGAGIGTGPNGIAGDITITGGNITAIGGEGGAGIGTSFLGTAGDILITGGTITAIGGEGGAGIGSGIYGITGGDITYVEECVTATGGSDYGGVSPDDIGAGAYSSSVGTITKIPYTPPEVEDDDEPEPDVEYETTYTTTTEIITKTEVYNGDGLILHVADQNNPYNKIEVFIDNMRALELGIDPLDVSSQESAGACINIIKNAINYVSKNRGDLGALQNRLERTINNNNNTSENMTSAKSAIKDTDMAKEMMEYTKMSVLTEASQSMLAQSNQAPQQILSLLG